MRSDVRGPGGPLAPAGFARFRALVEENLLRFLSPEVCPIPTPLRDAMEYALTSGGKRIRPGGLLSSGAAGGGGEPPLAGRGPSKAVRASAVLARAAGASGMAGGQMMDLRPAAGEKTMGPGWAPASASEESGLKNTAAPPSAVA